SKSELQHVGQDCDAWKLPDEERRVGVVWRIDLLRQRAAARRRLRAWRRLCVGRLLARRQHYRNEVRTRSQKAQDTNNRAEMKSLKQNSVAVYMWLIVAAGCACVLYAAYTLPTGS